LLLEARERGFVFFRPPLDHTLARRIAQRYELNDEQLTVVSARGTDARNALVEAAAELVMHLIKEMSRRVERTVGLGLGPGRATLDFSWALSHRLRCEPAAPKLRLHALTAGCPTRFPKYAPVSFFNLFPGSHVEESVGLFAETLVTCEEFSRIIHRAGIRDAFSMRDQVDIVVTSMGDMNHPHDLFRWFLEEAGMDVDALVAEGWIGNLQYRPYDCAGPVAERAFHQRAVTLFELSDYVEMVTKGRRQVVLLAAPCSRCGQPRTQALRPLLTEPSLKAWTHLIIDLNTALDLVAQA
jgi:DNA-binding transcriptional regulator LsrR (DeoR family)